MTEIDYEEQTAGYQASYSRLAASESGEDDPVAYVQNPQQFAVQAFGELVKQFGEDKLKVVVNAAAGQVGDETDRASTGAFVAVLRAGGLQL